MLTTENKPTKWEKGGPSPNPGGSRGRKPILDALNAYVTRPCTPDALTLPDNAIIADLIALRVIKNAVTGDDEALALKHFQEIMNRCYGMPKQAIVGGDENDKPVQVQHTASEAVIKAYLERHAQPKEIIIEGETE